MLTGNLQYCFSTIFNDVVTVYLKKKRRILRHETNDGVLLQFVSVMILRTEIYIFCVFNSSVFKLARNIYRTKNSSMIFPVYYVHTRVWFYLICLEIASQVFYSVLYGYPGHAEAIVLQCTHWKELNLI